MASRVRPGAENPELACDALQAIAMVEKRVVRLGAADLGLEDRRVFELLRVREHAPAGAIAGAQLARHLHS